MHGIIYLRHYIFLYIYIYPIPSTLLWTTYIHKDLMHSLQLFSYGLLTAMTETDTKLLSILKSNF